MSRQRLSLTALLLLLAAPAFPQRFTAAIRGNVTDPGNAVIAGAKVELKNGETGLTRTSTTNEAGNYVFADLPVGSYQVEVTSAGLKSEVQTGILINVADVREVNARGSRRTGGGWRLRLSVPATWRSGRPGPTARAPDS